MGSSFRWSPSILLRSTSPQTTSLPVSARQAPTTRPTYPVPTTAIRTGNEGLMSWCAAKFAQPLKLSGAARSGNDRSSTPATTSGIAKAPAPGDLHPGERPRRSGHVVLVRHASPLQPHRDREHRVEPLGADIGEPG